MRSPSASIEAISNIKMESAQGLIASTAAPQTTAKGVKLSDRRPVVLQAFSWASEACGNKKAAAASMHNKIILADKNLYFDMYGYSIKNKRNNQQELTDNTVAKKLSGMINLKYDG